MIENNKPELVEEDENESENSKGNFLTVGTIIIGSIIALMIFCIVMIVILEK